MLTKRKLSMKLALFVLGIVSGSSLLFADAIPGSYSIYAGPTYDTAYLNSYDDNGALIQQINLGVGPPYSEYIPSLTGRV